MLQYEMKNKRKTRKGKELLGVRSCWALRIGPQA